MLTFMVGNDFLPHLPTLPISSGGLDVMLDTYRQVRTSMPSYLLHHGTLQLPSLAVYLAALARAETKVAVHRAQSEAARAENTARRKHSKGHGKAPATGGKCRGGADATGAPEAGGTVAAAGAAAAAEAAGGEPSRGGASDAPAEEMPGGEAAAARMGSEELDIGSERWRTAEYRLKLGGGS